MQRKRFRYRDYIEKYFLIDASEDGQLVPFIFRKVQRKYYDDLQAKYNIEENGITQPIRENILKARKEGFSSMILALFAADDIMQDAPTETQVVSYKDDATRTFRKRYRLFVLSYWAQKMGYSKEEIVSNINLLDKIAPQVLSIDAEHIEHRANAAHFYCGTASARIGGRGGVLQKLLMSEIAFYPDSDKMSAAEIIEATMRQVDIASGWIFAESTENGAGTYQHKLWKMAKAGLSRFLNRFYGWPDFYSPEEFAVIASEYVDKDALRRDYPKDESDLFKGAAINFVSDDELKALVSLPRAGKSLCYWMELPGVNYIDQCEIIADTLETLERNNRGSALYAGIDVARDMDATVLTVIKSELHDITGGVKRIAIDSTGSGDFMPDWFERNTRWNIERVKFSRGSKNIMYKNLQVVIADKLTSLPILEEDGEFVSDEARHFHKQMTELQKEIKGEMLVVHHPPGTKRRDPDSDDEKYGDSYHDDYADSWALAEQAYASVNGAVERKQKPVKPATVPDALQSMLDRDRGHRRVRDTSYE